MQTLNIHTRYMDANVYSAASNNSFQIGADTEYRKRVTAIADGLFTIVMPDEELDEVAPVWPRQHAAILIEVPSLSPLHYPSSCSFSVV